MTTTTGATVPERLGHRARWTATLVVTPCAAAVFGAAVSWAAQTEPPKSATTISHAKATAARSALSAPDKAADTRTAALRRESAQGRQAATAMHHDLVALQVLLAQLGGDASSADSYPSDAADTLSGTGPAGLPVVTTDHLDKRPSADRAR
ncbi:MAG: hypothetical protein QOG98_1351 [Pseudonocardiales bacterium]|jgi:hypothetical protein|nr:hypothetical protein [Pseudonocardiales bacterium]